MQRHGLLKMRRMLEISGMNLRYDEGIGDISAVNEMELINMRSLFLIFM